jgi:hypothetical protein
VRFQCNGTLLHKEHQQQECSIAKGVHQCAFPCSQVSVGAAELFSMHDCCCKSRDAAVLTFADVTAAAAPCHRGKSS